jgi:L-fuconolactonase
MLIPLQDTLHAGASFQEAERVRIDASVTLGDREPEALWRILLRNRFEGALLCPWEYTRQETERHLETASRIDWIRGVVGVPGAPDHPRLVGIEARWPNVEAIHEASARGLVADVSVGLFSLSAVAKFAAAHPAIRITVLRTGGARYNGRVDEAWEAGMTELAACPNVRLKINGLLNNAPPGDPGGWGPASVGWRVENYKPWITHALRLFGDGRAMYGSDWPVCMANATWKESMACFTQAMGPRTETYRELILGGVAAGWYCVGA